MRALAGLFRGVPNEMERLPTMVPSLEDLCTTVVASVMESLMEIDDDTSVTEMALFRVASGAVSVKLSPDLERLFFPSSIFPLRLILTGTPSWTLISCLCVDLLGLPRLLGDRSWSPRLRSFGLPRRTLGESSSRERLCSSSSSSSSQLFGLGR